MTPDFHRRDNQNHGKKWQQNGIRNDSKQLPQKSEPAAITKTKPRFLPSTAKLLSVL